MFSKCPYLKGWTKAHENNLEGSENNLEGSDNNV